MVRAYWDVPEISLLEQWSASAGAWIAAQGEHGDTSRREILDPALVTILGDVAGIKVLDVGCGEGRYCRKLAGLGAVVTGIEPVPELHAAAVQRDPPGTYVAASAEQMPLPRDSFDVVLSYLSLVDIADDQAAAAEMVRVCKPGGKIVVVTLSNMASTTDNWVKDEAGNRLYRIVDRYMECFPLRLAWGGIEITNFHRPLSRTVGLFTQSGCVLTGLFEPLPEQGSKNYRDEHRCPTFQILVFRKEQP